MKYKSEEMIEQKIIEDELLRYKRTYEKAQERYAYGSASSYKTMRKYSVLERALVSYVRSDEKLLRQKLMDIFDVVKRAEKQIETCGAQGFNARYMMAEIRSILIGGR